ncbi:22949_t:CDS:2 [Gigaspora margarita]|uniref:22949_t:CDS:1 n=1 Tax=Gigaspora margarita TaxID=4874 RepID=A0ABM8W2R4_GIGMA|nr:22949_t:CDS:2 [Gigaspora margarita]
MHIKCGNSLHSLNRELGNSVTRTNLMNNHKSIVLEDIFLDMIYSQLTISNWLDLDKPGPYALFPI